MHLYDVQRVSVIDGSTDIETCLLHILRPVRIDFCHDLLMHAHGLGHLS